MTSERLLIINADDLGLAPGVTRGILDLARLGVVTSTSALLTLPRSAEAIQSAGAAGLDVGVHLTLSIGAPLSPPDAIPSLLTSDGRFPSARAMVRCLVMHRLARKEVEREWAAQIEAALDAGARPTHLDTHCHLHGLPPFADVMMELARRYDVPSIRPARAGFIFQPPALSCVRYVHPSWHVLRSDATPPGQPDRFTVLTVLGRLKTQRPLINLIRALPPGATELVCHPGYVDAELRALDPLTAPREREMLILGRPAFRTLLEREGVRLVRRAEV